MNKDNNIIRVHSTSIILLIFISDICFAYLHKLDIVCQCIIFSDGKNYKYMQSSLHSKAETIIRTSRLVGYQSTSRRQCYEVG